MVPRLDRMTLGYAYSALVETAKSHPRAFLTGGYLMLIPLGREYASALRIKVGAIGRATPVGESTTRVEIDASVADEVRLAV